MQPVSLYRKRKVTNFQKLDILYMSDLLCTPTFFSNTLRMQLYLSAVLNDAIGQRCCPLVVDRGDILIFHSTMTIIDVNFVSVAAHAQCAAYRTYMYMHGT